jgi:hypothetical protein
MNERFYVDEEDGDWCVFDSHQEPHKAVSSWSCEQDAKDDADRLNGLEKLSDRLIGEVNDEERRLAAKPAAIITIEIVVDEHWIDFAVNNNDLFRSNYCGYWLNGVAFDDDLGWLCYVDGDGGAPEDAEAQPVIQAWKAGEAFPENSRGKFYLLDRTAAIEAFKHGVMWRGAEWYENGDASSYDHVIQMALLGEIVYG